MQIDHDSAPPASDAPSSEASTGPTIAELLHEGRALLRATSFGPPGREAALLLAHVLGLDEARVRARDDQRVTAAQAARYRTLLERRSAATPVAYLLGRRELYGRDFAVDSRVLVPRPETEHLIEVALEHVPSSSPSPRLLDVGTGSGCIAVTLACERPAATVVATDLSLGALDLARANARRHGVDPRVQFLRTDLWQGLDLAQFDLVASNPPYVGRQDAAEMSPEVLEHEPHLALFADDGGRALLRRLLRQSEALRPGTPLILEIGYDQGNWIRATVDSLPFLELVDLVHDYAGHPRTAVLRRARSEP